MASFYQYEPNKYTFTNTMNVIVGHKLNRDVGASVWINDKEVICEVQKIDLDNIRLVFTENVTGYVLII